MAEASLGPGDKRKIWDIIQVYDKKHPDGPDSIAMAVLTAKDELKEAELMGAINRKTGVVNNSQAGRRLSVTMPQELYLILRRQYPLLFSNKEQFAWFKRNFKMFVVGR